MDVNIIVIEIKGIQNKKARRSHERQQKKEAGNGPKTKWASIYFYAIVRFTNLVLGLRDGQSRMSYVRIGSQQDWPVVVFCYDWLHVSLVKWLFCHTMVNCRLALWRLANWRNNDPTYWHVSAVRYQPNAHGHHTYMPYTPTIPI